MISFIHTTRLTPASLFNIPLDTGMRQKFKGSVLFFDSVRIILQKLLPISLSPAPCKRVAHLKVMA